MSKALSLLAYSKHVARETGNAGNAYVSLAPQFIRYTVNCTSRDSISHLLTHLVVYTLARCSSLNTTTFCLFPVCPVLPHPTVMSPDSVKYAAAATHRMAS